MNLNTISSATIDNILDEIDGNEQKEIRIEKHDNTDVNWHEILTQIRNVNINYIKNLISSNDININSQNPSDGKTLLIYSTIIGNIDLVKVICNFGADVHIKDHDDEDALNYAMKYGRYKITELLYYRQLSGSLGNDLKQIATQIHDKNKEAAFIQQINTSLAESIINFMITVIKQREVFDECMLYYAWYFILNQDNKHPLSSPLWIEMMKVYETILSNTSDKKGWDWLRKHFINSLIWYLPHPNNVQQNEQKMEDDEYDNIADDMEPTLKKTLFYELLIRVRSESKKQSDLLLKEKINKIKTQASNDWNELSNYSVNTKYSSNARQDICGCLIPEYNENDLSEHRYPPSTHFSAKKHYDTNMYLNNLIFRANILDSSFQRDIKLITKEISLQTGDLNATYRAGPVKTLTRSQVKVENDYINEDYPTSAKILDINRCAIQFKTIGQMMKYIEIFTEKIKNKKARSIIDIIRCKNGWSIYNPDYPQYTDLKLNVLIQSVSNGTIVGEIQFLLDVMSAFKKKAHKLYGVERRLDIIYNFAKLKNEMHNFKDVPLNKVFFDLTKNDDVKYFKLLWTMINMNDHTLFDIFNSKQLQQDIKKTSLFHVGNNNGEIHNYLLNEFGKIYYETVLNYITKYAQKYGYHSIFKFISNDGEMARFVKSVLFDTSQNDPEKVMKILLYHDRFGMTFIQSICESKAYPNSFLSIFKSSIFNDKNRLKLFNLYGEGFKVHSHEIAYNIFDHFKNEDEVYNSLRKYIKSHHYSTELLANIVEHDDLTVNQMVKLTFDDSMNKTWNEQNVIIRKTGSLCIYVEYLVLKQLNIAIDNNISFIIAEFATNIMMIIENKTTSSIKQINESDIKKIIIPNTLRNEAAFTLSYPSLLRESEMPFVLEFDINFLSRYGRGGVGRHGGIGFGIPDNITNHHRGRYRIDWIDREKDFGYRWCVGKTAKQLFKTDNVKYENPAKHWYLKFDHIKSLNDVKTMDDKTKYVLYFYGDNHLIDTFFIDEYYYGHNGMIKFWMYGLCGLQIENVMVYPL